MSIGAAEAEGVHSHQQRLRALRQRRELAHDGEVDLLEGDLRVEIGGVQRRRDLAVAQRQRRLEEAGDARCRLQVADIGLHRADEAGIAGAACRAEDAAERGAFHAIAGAGARTVGLDIGDVRGIDAGAAIDLAQELLLGHRIGQRDALGAAVGIDAGAEDHGVNRIPVSDRRVERLQDDDAATLRAHIAVGLGGEGATAAGGRQHRRLAEGTVGFRRQQDIDAAGDRQGALAAPQAVTGAVDSNKSGGARGVHGETGPVQIQDVGDPVRRHRQRRARRAIGIGDRLGGIPLQDAVVLVRDPDEDPGVRARQASGHDVRVLQCLPGQLQENALLGIHLPRLAR